MLGYPAGVLTAWKNGATERQGAQPKTRQSCRSPWGAARASAATKASLGFAPTLGAGRRGPSGVNVG